jgi:hypothetical protein
MPEIIKALGPLLPQRSVQLWSARAVEQRWLERVGASGSLTVPDGDALAVIANDATNTKLDWFLRRSISYDVETDGEEVRARVRIRLRNNAPTSGLPRTMIGPIDGIDLAPGVNRMLLSVFTPLDLVSASIDGKPADLLPITTEQGRNVVEMFVEVAPGSTGEVVVDLRGRLQSGEYALRLHRQPVVHRDRVRVTVDGDVLFDGEQDRDLVLRRP